MSSTVAPGFEDFVPNAMIHTASDLVPGAIIGLQFNAYGYVQLANVVSVEHVGRHGYIEVCYSWRSGGTKWEGSENAMPNGFVTFRPDQWVTTYRSLKATA